MPLNLRLVESITFAVHEHLTRQSSLRDLFKCVDKLFLLLFQHLFRQLYPLFFGKTSGFIIFKTRFFLIILLLISCKWSIIYDFKLRIKVILFVHFLFHGYSFYWINYTFLFRVIFNQIRIPSRLLHDLGSLCNRLFLLFIFLIEFFIWDIHLFILIHFNGISFVF